MTKERASYIMQLAKFDVPQYIQINLPKRRKQQLLSQPAFKFESTNLKIEFKSVCEAVVNISLCFERPAQRLGRHGSSSL
ncbi:hypothetical protein KY285_031167 [Solanum tuberosum]|nr:hypothetical protein KY285_031167 [Solanum tuberosum]